MSATIPVVDYLVLDPPARLRVHECTSCSARFFDRRNACSRCFAYSFRRVDLSDHGFVTTFSIVSVAAPGVPTPFVAAVVDCDGTSVRTNIINCPPDVGHVQLGMPVRLATYSMGLDRDGVEAVGFGFEPTAGRQQ